MAYEIDQELHTPVYVDPATLYPVANPICRAGYDLNVPQKRMLTAALKALAIVPDEKLEVTVTFGDVLRQFGLSDSSINYQHLRTNVKELAGQTVTVDTLRNEGFFPWFASVYIAKEKNYVRFRFNELLRPFISELKKDYTLIDTREQGKLRSLYAIRLYELVKSQEWREGSSGNKPGAWFYYVKTEDLKVMFAIGNKYKAAADFRKKVIEAPCEEINKAKLGITVTAIGVKEWRTLVAYKFNVTREKLADETYRMPVKEKTEEEKRREKNPQLWQECLQRAEALLDETQQKEMQLELDYKERDFLRHWKILADAQKILDQTLDKTKEQHKSN